MERLGNHVSSETNFCNNRRVVFSVQSVPRSYKKDKEDGLGQSSSGVLSVQLEWELRESLETAIEWLRRDCKKIFTRHSRSWALLEEPPIVQLLKNFPAFYGVCVRTCVCVGDSAVLLVAQCGVYNVSMNPIIQSIPFTGLHISPVCSIVRTDTMCPLSPRISFHFLLLSFVLDA
jgi:hypothetical protein